MRCITRGRWRCCRWRFASAIAREAAAAYTAGFRRLIILAIACAARAGLRGLPARLRLLGLLAHPPSYAVVVRCPPLRRRHGAGRGAT